MTTDPVMVTVTVIATAMHTITATIALLKPPLGMIIGRIILMKPTSVPLSYRASHMGYFAFLPLHKVIELTTSSTPTNMSSISTALSHLATPGETSVCSAC